MCPLLCTVHVDRPDSVVYPWQPKVGQWYQVAITRSGSDYSLYIDGEFAITEKDPNPIADPSVPLRIGRAEDYYLNGLIDEVRLYDRALSDVEVKTLYYYESRVELIVLPDVSSVEEKAGSISIMVQRLTDLDQPTTVSYGVSGGTATSGVDFVLNNGVLEFAAGVTEATIPLTILDDMLLEGSETLLLSLTNSASSWFIEVPLTIIDNDIPPTLTVQPQSQTVLLGSSAVLSVSATGSLPLHYQWRFNGTDLVEATTNTLTLANVQEANEGNYDVVVSNDSGSVTSQVAVLTVISPGEVPDVLDQRIRGILPVQRKCG